MSQGKDRLRGTWTFDFELGKEVGAGQGDVWWEQADAVHRYLVPQNGAQLAIIKAGGFESVPPSSIRVLPFAGLRLDGSDNSSNALTANTVIGVKTHNGHYAKVIILTYGYDLSVGWTTFQ